MSNYESKVAAYTEAIVDAVRLGIGHAVQVVADYGEAHPAARPYCDDLAAQLRAHTASVQAPTEESK